MNIAICIGCITNKPALKKEENGRTIALFQLSTVEGSEFNSHAPTLINCIAYDELAYAMYTRYSRGDLLAIRGRIVYYEESKKNVLRVLWQMNMQALEKPVCMGIEEFLSIYNPDEVLDNLRNLQYEQKKELKNREEENKDAE